MPERTARPGGRQRGAAMAEFAVVALPLLFAALFIVEAARWHAVRQMLHLALLEAARAGATAHARPGIIEQAFERALAPLFAPGGHHGSPRDRMRAAFLDVARQTGALAWRIDVMSPAPPAFRDFRDAALQVPGAPGLPAIRNDYQAEQHARRRRMGWPGGRGPSSGQTIFDANMLRLRLRYVHPPLVPGMRALLRRLAAMRGIGDPAARAGMLPIAMELALPMQSHPVQWQGNPDTASPRRRERGFDAPAAGWSPGRAREARPDAYGRMSAASAPAGQAENVAMDGARTADPPRKSIEGTMAAEPITGQAADAATSAAETAGPAGRVPPGREDDACGVVLCCGGLPPR